jgi:hypothetical protein
MESWERLEYADGSVLWRRVRDARLETWETADSERAPLPDRIE